MKIYHAELTTEALDAYRKLHPDKKVHALISYGCRDRHFRSMLSTHRTKLNGLILDSGTWTLNSNPAKYAGKIKLDGYLAYLNIRADDFDFYFNFDADFQVESYLRYQGNKFVERFDANSFLYITKAADYFDLERQHGEGSLVKAFSKTSAKFLVVSFTSDWLYPTYQSKIMVQAMKKSGRDVCIKCR